MNPKSGTIFINPKFKNAHINPNFLPAAAPVSAPLSTVHINPAFLKSLQQQSYPAPNPIPPPPAVPTTIQQPIVQKTNHKLVRKPSALPASLAAKRVPSASPLIKISRTKLLRASKVVISKPLPPPRPAALKLDRRRKVRSLLNISGVLYRSSPNRLRRQSAGEKPSDRLLAVRGQKFLLKDNGRKLERVGGVRSGVRLKRIDVAGLTYVPAKDGSFVRTATHLTRSYLSSARQRSINILSGRLKKTNVPCAIYRRLGKCLAFNRGRCPKVHDPKQIAVCPSFLRGACEREGCLLSHDVSFAKMPVCRYFLAGCCTKDTCPYLHKKLNEKAQVCVDFLKGFCPLADKCPRRHVFLCPDYDRTKTCPRVHCPYPHGEKQRRGETVASTAAVSSEKTQSERKLETTGRYFAESEQESVKVNDRAETATKERQENQSGTKKRPKLGALPAFIPI